MNANTGRPRIRTHALPKTRKTHRLASLTPAVRHMLRQAPEPSGFGTPAGYVRTCICGYHTRSGPQFANHLETEIPMTDILSFLDHPTGGCAIRHYLIDTAHPRKGETVYICSCGRDYRTLTLMQEHIRAMRADGSGL